MPKLGQNRGNAGKGRPKGSQNKLTATIKEAIEQSFSEVGGAKYLAEMAYSQPNAYMALLGKILPQQIDANVKAALLPGSIDDFVLRPEEQNASV
jgi:hypothetical protein